MKTHQIAIPVLLLLGSVFLDAQESKHFSRRQVIDIESAILGETRTISVYLPGNYATSEGEYPVLYLLDGQAHFQHASAAVDYLSFRQMVPGLIVVALHNIDRFRDFSPIHVDNFPTSGGAEKFLGFLSDELIPHVGKKYRSAGFDILLGHSLGGTFAVYAMVEEPELFDAYLAVSPYLMYANNHVVKQAAKRLKPAEGNSFFYMTLGDESGYFETLDEFSSLIREKAGDKMEFKYVKMEGENHATTPYLTLFQGLRFVLSDWPIPAKINQTSLEAIDDHYRSAKGNWILPKRITQWQSSWVSRTRTPTWLCIKPTWSG